MDKIDYYVEKIDNFFRKKDIFKNATLHNLKLFLLGGLIIYPTFLLGLLTLSMTEDSIFALLWKQLIQLTRNKWGATGIEYLNLFVIIYSICLVICIMISLCWLQVLTTTTTHNQEIIKSIITIILIICFLGLWGKGFFTRKILYLFNDFKITYYNNELYNSKFYIFWMYIIKKANNHNFLFLIFYLNKYIISLTYLLLTLIKAGKDILSLLMMASVYYILNPLFSWLVRDGDQEKGIYNINWLIKYIIFTIIALVSALLKFEIIWVLVVILAFFKAMINNFNRTLLNNSFILITSVFCVVAYNINNYKIMFMVFSSVVAALWGTEYIISKINILKNNKVNDIATNLFGSTIGGSIIAIIIFIIRGLIK